MEAPKNSAAKINVNRCLKIKGFFLAMKGPEVDSEIEGSQRFEEVLGGKLVRIDSFTLPKGITRKILIYEKVKATPKAFPRSIKEMKKA